jgi:hypothetical protein
MSFSSSTRAPFRLSVPGLLALLAVCSDDGRRVIGVEETAPPVIVSDPSPKVSVASAIGDAAREGSAASLVAAPVVSAAEEGIVYISLAPGTFPNGAAATIRNRDTGRAVATLLVGGGFDPVPVEARAEDMLELVVTGGSSATLYSAATRVPARRPPRVVRTVPPRGKTDVPLNARIMVVFSEPIDPATLTATSVRILRGADPVGGQLEFVDGNHLIAALVPETPLTPATDYQLVVSQAIRDRDGESLEAPVTIDFTTCANGVDASNCPPDPRSGTGLVSGVVHVRSGDGVQSLPNAIVGAMLFIIKPDVLQMFRLGPTTTDAHGVYRLTGVPDGFVVLYAIKDGYDQPCVATATVRADTPAASGIELVSQLDPHPEWATASPSIRGTVYETAPEGRRPVPGAWVVYELIPDGVTAATTTNEAGQYALCRLPSGQGGWLDGGWVAAVKPGYKTSSTVVVIANNDQVLDIELTRP